MDRPDIEGASDRMSDSLGQEVGEGDIATRIHRRGNSCNNIEGEVSNLSIAKHGQTCNHGQMDIQTNIDSDINTVDPTDIEVVEHDRGREELGKGGILDGNNTKGKVIGARGASMDRINNNILAIVDPKEGTSSNTDNNTIPVDSRINTYSNMNLYNHTWYGDTHRENYTLDNRSKSTMRRRRESQKEPQQIVHTGELTEAEESEGRQSKRGLMSATRRQLDVVTDRVSPTDYKAQSQCENQDQELGEMRGVQGLVRSRDYWAQDWTEGHKNNKVDSEGRKTQRRLNMKAKTFHQGGVHIAADRVEGTAHVEEPETHREGREQVTNDVGKETEQSGISKWKVRWWDVH
jgi:hypothetical protein